MLRKICPLVRPGMVSLGSSHSLISMNSESDPCNICVSSDKVLSVWLQLISLGLVLEVVSMPRFTVLYLIFSSPILVDVPPATKWIHIRHNGT